MPGFERRGPVTVAYSGAALAQYPVSIQVNTATLIAAGEMQADCRDSTFAAADGVTTLPYWLQSGCGTTTTLYWVSVPSVLSPSVALYFYWDNAAATSLSSPEAVNLFFDDFSSDPNTNGKWSDIYRDASDPANEFFWSGSTLFLTTDQQLLRAGGATALMISPTWENGWMVSFRYRVGPSPSGHADGFAMGFFHQGNFDKGPR